MQIAFDGADDRRVFRLYAGRHERRLQDFQRLLHRAGRNEHLGHKDFVPLELLPDDCHAGHQAVLDDVARLLSGGETLADKFGNFLAATGDDGLGERM